MALSDIEEKVRKEQVIAYVEKAQKLSEDTLAYLVIAKNILDVLIRNRPQEPFYYAARARAKWELVKRWVFTDFNEVIQDISEAIKLSPDSGGYYRLRGDYLLANLSGENRNQVLENIIADFKACLSKDPTDTQVWLNLIEMNILSHNWHRAISIYGECQPWVTEKRDRLIRSWLGCIALLFADEVLNEDDKKPLYDQEVEIALDERATRVKAFLNEARKEQAYKKILEKAIEINKLFESHRSKLDYYRKHSLERSYRYEWMLDAQDKGAMAMLSGSINQTEELWWEETRFYFGDDSSDDSRRESALQLLNKVIDVNPNDLEVWHKKGVILKNMYRREDAVDAFNRVITLSSSTIFEPMAWYNKGVCLRGLKRYGEALEAFERAIELKPDYADAWYGKGEMLQLLERNEEAVLALDKTTKLRRHYTEFVGLAGIAWFDKGILCEKLHLSEMALEAFKESIAQGPDKDHEKTYLKIGDIYAKLSRYEEALKAYDKVTEYTEYKELSIGIWAPIAWHLKALIYEEQNKYEPALEAYDAAMNACTDINMDHIKSYCLYKAALLEKLGRFEEAQNLRSEQAKRLYERARKYALENRPSISIRFGLLRAVTLEEKYKDQAKADDAFKSYCDDEYFKRIVG